MMLPQLFGISFEVPMTVLLAIPMAVAFLFLNRDVKGKANRLTLILRVAALAVLVLVLAVPYVVREEEIKQESTSILAIDDVTDSMSVAEKVSLSDIARQITDRTGGLARASLSNVTSPDRTAVGDAIYQGILSSSMRSNAIILFSDGRNNWGTDLLDAAAFAARVKARIFPILPKTVGKEVYISDVTGAEKTPLNSKYSGKVVIGSVGGEANYRLEVLVDGTSLIDTPVLQSAAVKEIAFEEVFKLRGPHQITARVTPEGGDAFSQNNVFNKVVNVIDRPNILLVTASNMSPLQLVLNELYDLNTVSELPKNLAPYGAVVIGDMPAASLGDLEPLRGFLNGGGGLVVVGGNHSYDAGGYYGSGFEGLLPVRSAEKPPKIGEKATVIIVLDISGSTGIAMGAETKIDVEKAIAVKMIRDLSKQADIGVVAFNADSFLIQPIRKLADTSALEEKVSRLQFGGGTYVTTGLIRAGDMLESVQGSKYIVLISDGVTNYPVQAFDKASSLGGSGVVIHSIGVGFDTDESFMRGISIRGNGLYFRPTETERVKIVIGGLEEGDSRKGFSFLVTDSHHFITEGLTVTNVSIKRFNEVSAKSSAQVLAASQGMKPLLAVWRFGLGRAASLMVDDGSEWAPQLYTAERSKIIASTVNWAVGDPERSKETRIDCTDARMGESVPVLVFSKGSFPKVTAGGEEMQLTRMDESNYYFDYYPLSAGFVNVGATGYECAMAVNYPKEYGSFGTDVALLAAVANMTGGRAYYPEETWQLVEDVSEYTAKESTGVAVKKTNLQLWFALCALVLFLADIILRRLREIAQSRPQGGRKDEKAAHHRPAAPEPGKG